MRQLKNKLMQPVVEIKRPKYANKRWFYVHYQVCTLQPPQTQGFSTMPSGMPKPALRSFASLVAQDCFGAGLFFSVQSWAWYE